MWAARGRKELEGQLIGFLCSWIHREISGETIDPARLNPYRIRPILALPAREVSEAESAAAWAVLGSALRGGA